MRAANRDEPFAEDVGSPALAVVRRGWWVIALTAIVTLVAAGLGLSLITPTYQATATLQAPLTSGLAQTPVDTLAADRLLSTYKQLAGQLSLRTQVARQLGLTHIPTFGVTIDPNTELLQLSGRDHSPARAARIANAAASALAASTSALARANSQAAENVLSTRLASLTASIIEAQRQLSHTRRRGARAALAQSIRGRQADYNALVQQQAQLQLADAVHDQTLSVIQPASIPTSPASPRWTPVLALALALGLLGGVALTFALERLRPRLYTMQGIEEAADAAVMAAIPVVTGRAAQAGLWNGASPAQEAFGVLAIQVLADAHVRDLRTIMVTSSSQGDGKSAISSNLSVELARSGHRVLLVDADMRSPSVDQIFSQPPTMGLSDLLEGWESEDAGAPFAPDELITAAPGIPNLFLLQAGPQPAAPARLLASERLGELIAELTAPGSGYDFVVFDAPPLVVSDPLSIARLVDLVLLVIGGTAVPNRDVQAASRQLRSVGAERISVVVNRWRTRENSYSYAYGS